MWRVMPGLRNVGGNPEAQPAGEIRRTDPAGRGLCQHAGPRSENLLPSARQAGGGALCHDERGGDCPHQGYRRIPGNASARTPELDRLQCAPTAAGKYNVDFRLAAKNPVTLEILSGDKVRGKGGFHRDGLAECQNQHRTASRAPDPADPSVFRRPFELDRLQPLIRKQVHKIAKIS